MKLSRKLKNVIKSKTFLRVVLLTILIFNLLVIRVVWAADTSVTIPHDCGYSQIADYTKDDYPTIAPTAASTNFCDIKGGFMNGLCEIGFEKILNPAVSGVAFQCEAAIYKTQGPQVLNAYLQQNNGGVLNFVNNVNAAILEQRPASGIQYFQDKVYALTHSGLTYAATIPNDNTLGNAKYYQGTGYDLLRPIQSFWGWSVRIVFALMILVIIVIAFAIMFRQKLPGNVEVTIQNSIPAIALALILIPFSYPICGLFIDFITLGTNVVHDTLIGPNSPGQAVFDNRDQLFTSPITNTQQQDRGLYPDDARVNWFNIRDNIDISQQVKDFGATIKTNANVAGGQSVDSFALFKLISDVLNLFSGKTENQGTPSYWIGAILNFIISLLMIWIGVMIFRHLFGKYLFLILLPIISPFVFVTIAIPGNGTKTIMLYLKTLLSASLGFIVTYFFFLLTLVFTNASFQNSIPDIKTGTFVPPLLGLTDILGNQDNKAFVSLLFSLIGVGIYFSIPTFLYAIDAALDVNDKLIKQIINTPIDSMRDALGSEARVAQIGFRGFNAVRKASDNGFYLPALNTAIRSRLNQTFTGLKPEDRGSFVSGQSAALGRRMGGALDKEQKALNVLNNPNSTFKERLDAQGNLKAARKEQSDIQDEAKRRNLNITGAKDKISLAAKFVWDGKEGNIIFDRDFINSFSDPATNATPYEAAAGQLILEATNYPLFPAQTIFFGGPVDYTTTTDVDFYEFGTPFPPGANDPTANKHLTPGRSTAPYQFAINKEILGGFMVNDGPIVNPNVILTVDVPPPYRPEGGKLYKIRMRLIINNPHDVFYGSSAITDFTQSTGVISPRNKLHSFKRMFRIKDPKTGYTLETAAPLKVIIMYESR